MTPFRSLMICLLAGCSLFAQMPVASAKPKGLPPEEQLYTMRGRILTTGTDLPVAGAQVVVMTAIAYAPGDTESIKKLRTFQASSNASGEFEVALPAGDYTYQVKIEGYALDATSAARFTIEEGKTPERLTIRMLRAATMSGIVEDSDGEPIGGVQVEAINIAGVNRTTRSERTGANGEFAIHSLLPGSYILRANMLAPAAGNTETLVTSYYPGTTNSFAAAEIALNGVDVPSIRIQMQRAELRSVSGRVTGRDTNSFAGQFVTLQSVEDYRSAFSLFGTVRKKATIAEDGTFQIANVPPGRYTARVEGDQSRVIFPLAMEEISVGDRDIDDLRMTVSPGGVFGGKIVVEAGDVPSNWSVHLRGQSVAGLVETALTIGKDGSFSIDGVVSGTYEFMSVGRTRFAVNRVEIGGRKFEGSKFSFAPPGAADVVIFASATGATIQGTLEGSRDPEQAVTGIATVALVSGFTDRVPVIRNAPLAKDGSFSITSLAPGRYFACAWTEPQTQVNLWLEEGSPPVEKLRNLCKTVDLRVGASESVEVRLTSMAEVMR